MSEDAGAAKLLKIRRKKYRQLSRDEAWGPLSLDSEAPEGPTQGPISLCEPPTGTPVVQTGPCLTGKDRHRLVVFGSPCAIPAGTCHRAICILCRS